MKSAWWIITIVVALPACNMGSDGASRDVSTQSAHELDGADDAKGGETSVGPGEEVSPAPCVDEDAGCWGAVDECFKSSAATAAEGGAVCEALVAHCAEISASCEGDGQTWVDPKDVVVVPEGGDEDGETWVDPKDVVLVPDGGDGDGETRVDPKDVVVLPDENEEPGTQCGRADLGCWGAVAECFDTVAATPEQAPVCEELATYCEEASVACPEPSQPGPVEPVDECPETYAAQAAP